MLEVRTAAEVRRAAHGGEKRSRPTSNNLVLCLVHIILNVPVCGLNFFFLQYKLIFFARSNK